MSTLSEIIQSHEREVLDLWTTGAGRAASAQGLSGAALFHLFPALLASLGGEGGAIGTLNLERQTLLDLHVASRLRQGFDLAELLEELTLLESSISQLWAGVAPVVAQPERAEIESLHREVQLASVAVTRVFTRHMLHDEQTDKRFIRLLHTLARQGLGTGAVPLRDRLGEMLVLVMEATGVQSVALVLVDGPGHEPAAAAVGYACEQVARSLQTHVGSTLDGRDAGGAPHVEISSVASGSSPVTDELRAIGLKALLAAQLSVRDRFVGTLYLGLTEARTFSAREAECVESLGELITLHLDNARLYADLLEKNATLHVERSLREEFVTLLAHDLRGPLGAARGTAQILSRHPELLDQRCGLALRIDRSLERADRMIVAMLDTHRIHAGERIPVHLSPGDLGALASEVLDELSSVYGSSFILNQSGDTTGTWDLDQVRRATWNLAANAFKYGSPGAPVTVSVVRSRSSVLISVHNLGNPLTPDDQMHIFDPFSRTQSAIEGPRSGWGLGLTLVRGCAESHGGTVTVESSAEQGTTFTLELPAVQTIQ